MSSFDSLQKQTADNIARAHAAQRPVDHNGRPTTPQVTYTYGPDGRLVDASATRQEAGNE